MYFGGINGFNVFTPEDIKDNPFIPKRGRGLNGGVSGFGKLPAIALVTDKSI